MRKSLLFLMVILSCIVGIRCSNPAGPEKAEYRYNVEFTYSRPADYELNPTGRDEVWLSVHIYDPTADLLFYLRDVVMTKAGELTYKGFVDKIYVQKPGEEKHQAVVTDYFIKDQTTHAEYISIQGAYDLETRTTVQGGTALLFRMAKN
jgi:hypothetical protein